MDTRRPRVATNSTGFRGVRRRTDAYRAKPFEARVTVDGRKKSLGSYATAEEAGAVAAAARRREFGDFAGSDEG